jgi:hypothetical protein
VNCVARSPPKDASTAVDAVPMLALSARARSRLNSTSNCVGLGISVDARDDLVERLRVPAGNIRCRNGDDRRAGHRLLRAALDLGGPIRRRMRALVVEVDVDLADGGVLNEAGELAEIRTRGRRLGTEVGNTVDDLLDGERVPARRFERRAARRRDRHVEFAAVDGRDVFEADETERD